MTFHVYPDPQTSPLNVAAGATSSLIPIVELVPAGTPPQIMRIRIAMLGPVPATSNQPTVILQANTGAKVAVPTGVTAAIYRLPGPSGPTNPDVADAIINAPDANNVYLVRLFVNVPGSSWQMSIKNNDITARNFTWVVADSDSDSQQPWIDVANSLVYDVLTSQSVPLALSVANKGTGALNITDTAGTSLGSGFTLTTIPGPINPNSSGNVSITFLGPATPGLSNATYTVQSNDTTALINPPHNKSAALSATTRELELMLLLDASGSMGYTPLGDASVAPTDARWSKLETSADQFLELVRAFGSGKGRFAVGVFPDITGPNYPAQPAPSPSSADFQAAADVSDTPINNTESTLDTHSAFMNKGATPMGHGIGRAIGTDPVSFGYFKGDTQSLQFNRRWLVLMSDGANNSGPPNPGDFYPPGASPGDSFTNKFIRVAAVAYGDTRPDGTTFQVDHALLQTIVMNSNGVYLDAGVDDAGLQLRKQLRSAINVGLSLDPSSDPEGILTTDAPEVRSSVAITPYDTKVAFVVSWGTFEQDRLDVELLSPTCELITAQTAAQDPNVTFVSHPRFKMFTLDNDYLRNAKDPAHPRYGNWTLVIAGNFFQIGVVEGAAVVDSEIYEYEVINESRLKLDLKFDQPIYYAGDQIELAAAITLDGLPVPQATVTLNLTAPGQGSDNLLAQTRVTADDIARAVASLHGEQDVNTIGIKSLALKLKGVTFDSFANAGAIPMTDAGNQGVYRATVSQTQTPGTYGFYVTAVGQTNDGVSFRRELRRQQRLEVRPEPEFSLLDVIYRQVIDGARTFFIADTTVHPRDRYGNVVLVDPATSSRVALSATGGQFTGPLVGNLDGSYSQSLNYPPGVTPSIGLQVDGQTVIPPTKIAPVARLHYVDQVVGFQLGNEAVAGANQHRDPQAALGDVTTKPTGQFVSLGGFGSLTVDVQGQFIIGQGEGDLTVFVQPDEDLRPYLVEALSPSGSSDEWIALGVSLGITQSFSLGRAGLDAARAIRITDRSGRIRDSQLNASSTPGVSILGVGVKKISASFEGRRKATNSGFMVQSTFGVQGDFELVVPDASGGLAHCVRRNDEPGAPWEGPTIFGTSLGNVDAASLIQSNFGHPGNLEVVARSGNLLAHFWRDSQPPYAWHGPFHFEIGVSGNPALIQSRFGSQGNFELVVPLAAGGLAHYSRNNDLPNLPWSKPTIFGANLGHIDAVTLIQSNLGHPGNLEVVARVGSHLLHFWRGSELEAAWNGPLTFFSGATGIPGFIQSRFGKQGNFEVVTPLSAGGMAHMRRDNDDPAHPWNVLARFGSGSVTAVSLMQSNFGNPGLGHLEVAARVDNRTALYWRTDVAPFTWTGPTGFACA